MPEFTLAPPFEKAKPRWLPKPAVKVRLASRLERAVTIIIYVGGTPLYFAWVPNTTSAPEIRIMSDESWLALDIRGDDLRCAIRNLVAEQAERAYKLRLWVGTPGAKPPRQGPKAATAFPKGVTGVDVAPALQQVVTLMITVKVSHGVYEEVPILWHPNGTMKRGRGENWAEFGISEKVAKKLKKKLQPEAAREYESVALDYATSCLLDYRWA